MQSFLPIADFTETARILDPRRLGKQRVEALQILRGLIVPGYGWRHHPAVKKNPATNTTNSAACSKPSDNNPTAGVA